MASQWEQRKEYFQAWRKTPQGKAKDAWDHMKERCRTVPQYIHVEVKLSRKEFIQWAVPAFAIWMRDNPGLLPSVDRIDSSGHYEIGNIAIIEFRENCRKTKRNKSMVAPKGTSWCRECKAYLPIAEFYTDRYNKATGLSNRCKTHSDAARLKRSKRQRDRERAKRKHATDQ